MPAPLDCEDHCAGGSGCRGEVCAHDRAIPMLCFCPMLPTPQGSGCGHCRSARQQLPHTLLFQRWPQFPRVPLPLSLRTAHSGAVLGRSLKAGQSPSALRFLAGLSLPVTGNSSTYKVTAGALRCWAQEGLRDEDGPGGLRLLALPAPTHPSPAGIQRPQKQQPQPPCAFRDFS